MHNFQIKCKTLHVFYLILLLVNCELVCKLEIALCSYHFRLYCSLQEKEMLLIMTAAVVTGPSFKAVSRRLYAMEGIYLFSCIYLVQFYLLRRHR